MSDAKAKAEARRAKILSRENARLSMAKGEGAAQPVSEVSISKEARPLAARRNLVKTGKIVSAESTSPAENDSITHSTKFEDLQEDESIKQDTSESKSVHSPIKGTEGVLKMEITPKIVKEVEKEIAEHTAKFDASISSSIKSSAVTDKAAIVKKKQALSLVSPSAAIEPSSVLRLVRLTIIILVAIYTGFNSMGGGSFSGNVASSLAVSPLIEITVEDEFSSDSTLFVDSDSNNNKAASSIGGGDAAFSTSGIAPSSTPQPGIFDVLSTLTRQNSLFGGSIIDMDGTSRRTWGKWASEYLHRQLESSVSAMGLVWWLSSILQPIISKVLPKAPSEKGASGIIGLVMSIYNNGFDGVLESTLGSTGEVALYTSVVSGSIMSASYVAERSLEKDAWTEETQEKAIREKPQSYRDPAVVTQYPATAGSESVAVEAEVTAAGERISL